ncbi:tetraacyldisaccharide 4'-kinase [Marinomonas flavescens]|uniref:tetraacyldisaccharide 4'-kinase n=1 Tax=Marinomonas flavescens TaxID=2529379 RepID=UPI001F0A545F|nr:tetraacyldisaccharide 4'-kinase [Marinomonas flavescens]
MPFIKNAIQKKRAAFLANPNQSYTAPIPVVIVGNISVGGTGKSPMVVALCKFLIGHGFKPGIISRGHGVKLINPIAVNSDSLASQVGDEPVMLARRTQCPVVVFPQRAEAIKQLLATTDVDVIVCDDGMQHYGLNRDIEIAMVDAQRGLGNGQLLPVGPLREPISRLDSVDYVMSVTDGMTQILSDLNRAVLIASLSSSNLVSLDGKRELSFIDAFREDQDWHIMAGIGNPDRFLVTLKALGLNKPKSVCWFGDHHNYIENDIPEHGRVIMTEKDAVKCQALAIKNLDIWYLPVSLALPEAFTATFLQKLQHINNEKRHE